MSERNYRFADFELVVSEAELRNGNLRVRLQQKPLILLTTLLDHPQRLVPREQLRECMWGNETFVDYEQGINVAVKKIRDALGDSSDEPKYIQTVAKKGYRFLLPVEVMEPRKTDPDAEIGFLTTPEINLPQTAPPSRGWIDRISAIALLLLLASLLLYIRFQRPKVT